MPGESRLPQLLSHASALAVLGDVFVQIEKRRSYVAYNFMWPFVQSTTRDFGSACVLFSSLLSQRRANDDPRNSCEYM